MGHIRRKTQLECVIPRVPNNRQLRMSLSFCEDLEGVRELIRGPYGKKVWELEDHTGTDWTGLGTRLAVML